MADTKKMDLGLLDDNFDIDFENKKSDDIFNGWVDKNPMEQHNNEKEINVADSRFNFAFDNPQPSYKKPVKKLFNNLDKFQFKKDLNIKILGVGGAGNNMIEHMANHSSIDKSSLYAINTDYQVLRKMPENINVILIGNKITNGYGSGSDPEIGKKAALEDEQIIREILEDTDLLFIVSGMGKGTGTGASPVISSIAKEMGILTLSIINLPSISNEGPIIFKKGEDGLLNLKKYSDGILTISNEKLFNETSTHISLLQAFVYANSVITNVIYEIISLISIANKINVDFNDVKNFFKDQTNFQLNTFSFDNEQNIEEQIIEQLKYEIYQDSLDKARKIIVNFKLNPSVTRDFINSFIRSLNNITKNSELEITLSIDYFDSIEFAKITLLSAKEKINEQQSISLNTSNKEIDHVNSSIHNQSNQIHNGQNLNNDKILDVLSSSNEIGNEINLEVINTKTEELEKEQKTITINTNSLEQDHIIENTNNFKIIQNNFKDLKEEINISHTNEKEYESVRRAFIPTKKITEPDVDEVETRSRTVRFNHPTGPGSRN